MNTVTISGDLTGKPETGKGKTGVSWAQFRVSLTEHKRDKPDEKHTFDVKIFGVNADRVGTLEPGAHVVLSGKLRQERWDYQGRECSKIVIHADSIVGFIGDAAQPSKSEPAPVPAPASLPDPEDDVPF